MTRKEQNTIRMIKKKPQNTTMAPEPLKPESGLSAQRKTETDGQKEDYSKPIFKTRRFDLL